MALEKLHQFWLNFNRIPFICWKLEKLWPIYIGLEPIWAWGQLRTGPIWDRANLGLIWGQFGTGPIWVWGQFGRGQFGPGQFGPGQCVLGQFGRI